MYMCNVKENNDKRTCRVEQSLKLLQEILHQMHNLQTSQLSACSNCQFLTDYKLHLPCTLYVVLISRLFIQHIANMPLAHLPLCTLQYLHPPPPPKKKKIGITLVFHFSREQCITAVQRETENNAYANFSGGNKVHYHGRCASGEREEKIKF